MAAWWVSQPSVRRPPLAGHGHLIHAIGSFLDLGVVNTTA